MWFMDDLYGFHVDAHTFEALNKMLSWKPTAKFHIIARRQFSSATPTFVKLLGATIYYGDGCMAALTNIIPIWRGSLLLSNSNQVAINDKVWSLILLLLGYNITGWATIRVSGEQ